MAGWFLRTPIDRRSVGLLEALHVVGDLPLQHLLHFLDSCSLQLRVELGDGVVDILDDADLERLVVLDHGLIQVGVDLR